MDTYKSGEKSQVPCSKPEQERGGVEGSALAKSQRSSHGVQEEEATSLFSAAPFMEDTPFCLVSPREDGQPNSSPKLWRGSESAAEAEETLPLTPVNLVAPRELRCLAGLPSVLIITGKGCQGPQTRRERRRENKVMKALVTPGTRAGVTTVTKQGIWWS